MLSDDGLPVETRRLAGRTLGAASRPLQIAGGGLVAGMVEHQSLEMEVPAQTHHRLSIAVGRRPGVWTDIPGIKTAQDLGHLHANIVPASHTTWVDDPTPGRFLFLEIATDTGGLGEGDHFTPVPAFNLDDPVLKRAAVRLLSMLSAPTIADDLRCGSVGIAVATRLRILSDAQRPLASSTLGPWRMRQLVEFIDANMHGRLKVEDLARIADMPVVEFLSAFQASFGVPPFRYAAFVRVRDLRLRLENERSSPEEIAQRLG